MSLKGLFVPDTVKTFSSVLNGEIKLVNFAGEYRLDVGGLTQSGSVMVWVWSAGIKNLLPLGFVPQSVLVLGLGGGSVLAWLSQRYPKADLTAVEIDPVMIEISKKHFHITRIKNLKIINADAVDYIQKTKDKFDLILVDCFQGHTTPAGFEDPKILKIMKSKCNHLLLNRLYWDDFKIKTDDFVARLASHFLVKSVYTASNLIISLT